MSPAYYKVPFSGWEKTRENGVKSQATRTQDTETHTHTPTHRHAQTIDVCPSHTPPPLQYTPTPLKPRATCRSHRVAKAAVRAGLEGWPEGGGGGCSLVVVLPLGEQPSAGGGGSGQAEAGAGGHHGGAG